MTDTITLTGIVATIPRVLKTSDDLAITSFRLASTQRRFDRNRNRWVDGETNWYTITTFRQLATNAASSVVRGDRVIVAGRVRIREWEAGERKGTTVEVEADAVGHDLTWGTTAFTRVIMTAAASGQHDDADDQEPRLPGSSDASSAGDAWATPGVLTDAAAGAMTADDAERESAAVDYGREDAVTPF
jgi:single-strand DNA-binding protein